MSLQARRPPGHAKRKARAYTADILSLRRAGHSLQAIREALEDAGVRVSISTVRRELLKGASTTAACGPATTESAVTRPLTPREVTDRGGSAGRTAAVPRTAQPGMSLPGRAIAEDFMRGRPTNTLFLEEPPQ